jgi:hypothetical protein
VTTVAEPDAIGEATRLVAEASALLAGLPHGREYESAEASVTGDPHTSVFASPFVGSLNPLAPPLIVDMVDETIVATGVFGDQYEGPPGYVHGGVIAAVFDEVLGFAQPPAAHDRRLTIRRRPYRVVCRWPGRSVIGRKIFTIWPALPRRDAVPRRKVCSSRCNGSSTCALAAQNPLTVDFRNCSVIRWVSATCCPKRHTALDAARHPLLRDTLPSTASRRAEVAPGAC